MFKSLKGDILVFSEVGKHLFDFVIRHSIYNEDGLMEIPLFIVIL